MSSIRFLLASILVAVPNLAARSNGPVELEGQREKAASALAFSPDGKLLVSGGGDERIRIWDIAARKETFRLDAGMVYALTFSSDGKTFAAATKAGEIQVYDALKGKEMRRWKAHDGPVAALTFAPDGVTLASGGYDSVICLWNAVKGTKLRQFDLPKDRVDQGNLNPAYKKTVWLRFDFPIGKITSLAFSADGKQLLSGGLTRAVYAGASYYSLNVSDHLRLWDVAGKEKMRVLPTRGSRVAFSATGKRAAGGGLSPDDSNGLDGRQRIGIIDLATGREIQEIKWRGEEVAIDPKGKYLATAAGNFHLHWEDWGGSANNGLNGRRLDLRAGIWDLASGKETLRLPIDRAVVAVFSPNGKTLATGSWKGAIHLWDLDKEKTMPTPDPLEIVAIPPAKDKLARLLHEEYEAMLKREKNPEPIRRAALLFHQKNPIDALILLRTVRSPASIPLILRYALEDDSSSAENWWGRFYQDTPVLLSGQEFPREFSRENVERLVKTWWLPNKDKLTTDIGKMSLAQKRVIARQLTRSDEPKPRDPDSQFADDPPNFSARYHEAMEPQTEGFETWWPQDLHPDLVPLLLNRAGYTDKPPVKTKDSLVVTFSAVPMLAFLRKNGQAPQLDKIAMNAGQTTAVRLTSYLALVKAGEAMRTADVIDLLAGEKKVDWRIAAILMLANGKSADTAATLIKLLDDADYQIRAAAFEAMLTTRPPQAVPRLKKFVDVELAADEKQGFSDPDFFAAIGLLGEIGTPEAQAILADFLAKCKPGDTGRRRFGVRAFQQATGQHWITPPDWSDDDYRQAAQRALVWWAKKKVP